MVGSCEYGDDLSNSGATELGRMPVVYRVEFLH
jgi:hypothetical protein